MSTGDSPVTCPICIDGARTVSYPRRLSQSVLLIECANCGTYNTSREMHDERFPGMPLDDRVRVSSWIRDRWRRGDQDIIVLKDDVEAAVKNVPHLGPAEKANRLLEVLCDYAKGPGTPVSVTKIRPRDAWSSTPSELNLYANWLMERGFVERRPGGGPDYNITVPGWIEVERLRSTREAVGNRAFMAMKFGDHELNEIVEEYFVPAAARAGFELRRSDDKQPAGLIDNHMRVSIRTAKVLVCDVTHANLGAYWEAGFAEGIGKPVIFTCREDVLEDRMHPCHPHFDTNHMKTIPWGVDPGVAAKAAEELTVTIRATLPSDAKLEDD
jgi:hypothetical protein